jgi:SAM-dependent methyltransferase
MNLLHQTVVFDDKLYLSELAKNAQKPPYFEPSSEQFWNDPHIAQQMLAAHLDPDSDAASRSPQTIDQTVQWLIGRLKLKSGTRLLDLGCGPGLYCKRFANYGLKVTGVDFSENSLRYAREHDPLSNYIHQNYLAGEPFEGRFDVVTLIYGDFCVPCERDRTQLLNMIYGVLNPGGYFVFDVTTRIHFTQSNTAQSWTLADKGGFWKATPHLVLMERFDYPEHNTFLDQYLVIEENGRLSVYRNWFQCYTLETITEELARSKFKVASAYSDLIGTPYAPTSAWIGLLAQKV